MATAISVATKASGLNTIFANIKHVYYSSSSITSTSTTVSGCIELPILEDGVTFNTGSIDKTEINLIDGQTWTSKETKGDSDITFQVASVNSTINNLFLTVGKTITGSTLKEDPNGAATTTWGGKGYALDIKKSTGALIMVDSSGSQMVIVTNVEMTGSLVLGDGDNPAYFNVTVTPKANSEGDAILLLTKSNG